MNIVRNLRERPVSAPSLFEIMVWSRCGAAARWGAIAGIGGGTVSGLLGVAIVVMSPLLSPAGIVVGNGLLFAVIPLLFLGAHCLDCLERGLDSTSTASRKVEEPVPRARPQVVSLSNWRRIGGVALLATAGAAASASAQEAVAILEPPRPTASEPAPLTERERMLLDRVERLEQRVAELETAATARPASREAEPAVAPVAPAATDAAPASQAADAPAAPFGLPEGTTVNVTIDGYYGYNLNTPVGGVSLLRAYDPTSNSFNLAQANVVVERAPDVDAGRRYGLRLDLQFGQATETVQGSAANELRPQAYRNILQAYGAYVVPVGKGLTVDFGKWTSALGYEGHYAKDQINYTRSYWFNFLPYYHNGFRATYAFNDKVSATYWLVNGAQQTEDFNGFKSQALLVNLKPHSCVSWNLNYYQGIEGRGYVANLNPTFATLPTQPGLPVAEVRPSPRGRFHVLDTHASWAATDRLLLVGAFDYVVSRAEATSPPVHVIGGGAYARYQLADRHAVAARGEYLSDRGGLFSGITQALKETTATYEYKLADGFLTRLEYRRDFSNQPFFLTQQQGVLKKEQNTFTLGLVWWMGLKQGGW